jgi:ATP-dependent RNA circularization protein (DNA/RNA ligase family)
VEEEYNYSSYLAVEVQHVASSPYHLKNNEEMIALRVFVFDVQEMTIHNFWLCRMKIASDIAAGQ